jgi:hypothetical protein
MCWVRGHQGHLQNMLEKITRTSKQWREIPLNNVGDQEVVEARNLDARMDVFP